MKPLNRNKLWAALGVLLLGACFSSSDASRLSCGWRPIPTLHADAGLVTLVSYPGQQLRVDIHARADRPGGSLKNATSDETFRPCQNQPNCALATDLPLVETFDYTLTDLLEDGGFFGRGCGDVSSCEGHKVIDFVDRRPGGGPGHIQFHYALDLLLNEPQAEVDRSPASLDLQLRFFDAGFAPGTGPGAEDGGADGGI